MLKRKCSLCLVGPLMAGIVVLWWGFGQEGSPPSAILAVASGDACTGSAAEQGDWPLVGAVVGSQMNTDAAMSFLFADYDAEQGAAPWCPPEGSMLYGYFSGAFQSTKMHSAVAFSATYHQGGEDRFLIILQTAPPFSTCHACDVALGAAIFVRRDGLWRLEGLHPAITRAGSNGRAPEATALVQIGPDLLGVAMRPWYLAQGYTVEGFLLLGPVGDEWKELLWIADAGGDNQGVCEDTGGASDGLTQPKCWRYASDIRFVPGPNLSYLDIEVLTNGTRRRSDDHDLVESFQRVAIYGFSGCRYFAR